MSVIAVGNFDGVHLGHQKLIKETYHLSQKYNLKSCIITFERIFSIPQGRILTPLAEKSKLLSKFPIDSIIILPNEDWLWQMSPEKFISSVLLKIKPRYIVVGYNFKFGKDAKGTVGLLSEVLRKKNIVVKIISPVKYNGEIISSSYIRQLLCNGQVEDASKLIGRLYSVTGEVKKGKGIASQLGFPTINLDVDQDKLIPSGIFSGIASDGFKNYNSIIYAGKSPTTKKLKSPEVEFHILDKINFKTIKKHWDIYFIKKIRDERKFQTIENLKKQIKKDIIIAERTGWL